MNRVAWRCLSGRMKLDGRFPDRVAERQTTVRPPASAPQDRMRSGLTNPRGAIAIETNCQRLPTLDPH